MELDRLIGCIAVTQPVFFTPDEWVRVPDDFAPSIMRGKTYDLSHGEGLRIWTECLERAARSHPLTEWTTEAIELRRTGKPQFITPRLGRSSFRLAVLDAYDGACAVTNEPRCPSSKQRTSVLGAREDATNFQTVCRCDATSIVSSISDS